MTALSDAYAGTVAAERSRHRLVLGVALFLLGSILVVAGIVAAGSGVLTARGVSLGEARWLAGILGGIGVPAVFLGIFTILPASRTTRGTALIGASVAMFGVALFAHAYPCQWIGNTCATDAANLTLPTAGVYFAGTLTTFWCLFTAVANFKTRNDPGGTVTMEIRKMTAPPVESDESSGFGSFGSVGLFGSEPEGDVATQTNTPGASSPAGAAAATSDGGAATQQLSTPSTDTPSQPQSTTDPTTPSTTTQTGSSTSSQSASTSTTPSATDTTTASQGGVDQVSPKSSRRGSGGQPSATNGSQSGGSDESSIDRYCGSCAQFKYVRTDNGIQPYCAYHDELMDDMESCESWEPRS
ncbi:ribonuclease BN [Halonotius terrestris]|uniref:Ribonuclease BN n=1 Tax=Halonotius terrestris TaxID=2487750 RepID=A0A8J8PEW2_9EURY|nr:YihY/virulence factor BrkB family protein [Halonotius terrestris]TQQ83417.1 ribonuclease BN [Halonotius terrestris]